MWRHEFDIVTWRHRWRHQSTRRRHLPIGSLLTRTPLNRSVPRYLASKVADRQTCRLTVRVAWSLRTRHTYRHTVGTDRYRGQQYSYQKYKYSIHSFIRLQINMTEMTYWSFIQLLNGTLEAMNTKHDRFCGLRRDTHKNLDVSNSCGNVRGNWWRRGEQCVPSDLPSDPTQSQNAPRGAHLRTALPAGHLVSID